MRTPGAPSPGFSCCAAAASSSRGPGPTQRCDRRVTGQECVVRAVAGHMHLLGRSIKVELDPGRRARSDAAEPRGLGLRQPGRHAAARPVRVRAGDMLRVTCTHDAGTARLVPELENEQPRYVTWGEGTSDEMCLGILIYTRP